MLSSYVQIFDLALCTLVEQCFDEFHKDLSRFVINCNMLYTTHKISLFYKQICHNI